MKKQILKLAIGFIVLVSCNEPTKVIQPELKNSLSLNSPKLIGTSLELKPSMSPGYIADQVEANLNNLFCDFRETFKYPLVDEEEIHFQTLKMDKIVPIIDQIHLIQDIHGKIFEKMKKLRENGKDIMYISVSKEDFVSGKVFVGINEQLLQKEQIGSCYYNDDFLHFMPASGEVDYKVHNCFYDNWPCGCTSNNVDKHILDYTNKPLFMWTSTTTQNVYKAEMEAEVLGLRDIIEHGKPTTGRECEKWTCKVTPDATTNPETGDKRYWHRAKIVLVTPTPDIGNNCVWQ